MEKQACADYNRIAEAIAFLRENTRSQPGGDERADRATTSGTAFETGLSGTDSLHDLFVHIEGMSPQEYKNGGSGLHIHYNFADSPFGPVLVASTPKGICYLGFEDHREQAFRDLMAKFPNAKFEQKADALQENALSFFRKDRISPGFPVEGMGKLAENPVRTPGQLRKHCRTDRSAEGVAGGRHGHRQQSHRVPDPLPPRGARLRQI